MEFKKYNANPKGIKAGDCVIRAISMASERSWEGVYTELYDIGFRLKRMPSEKLVFEKWLEQHGWVKGKMPRHNDGTRYTVREWVDSNPTTIVIISVASHLTHSDHGVLIDTWNCGSKCVGNYWVKGE